jgi:hypothetical protein
MLFPELLTILEKVCRAEVTHYKVRALKLRLPNCGEIWRRVDPAILRRWPVR